MRLTLVFYYICGVMKLHYFNPENDISLGLNAGQRLTTMSPMVSALHDAGSLLPVWYGDDGDRVLVEKSFDGNFVDRLAEEFGLNVLPVAEADVCGVIGAPWGWSHDSACRLSEAGALVPDKSVIDSLKQLSHRRTSRKILTLLKERTDIQLPGLPVEAHDEARVASLLEEWGSVYVKQPWSSSGRGVFRLTDWSDSIEGRVSGMIKRQGSVMVEPEFEKKKDFAMLFHSELGKTDFAGYSLFFNSVRGAYGGNLIASDEVIEDRLVAMGASRRELSELKLVLSGILTELVSPVYNGYMGIDMMLGCEGSIAPCVELNLRMTMGVVAARFRDGYLDPDSVAVFRVGRAGAEEFSRKSDYEIKKHRLRSGSVFLTPPAANGFVFSVEAFPKSSGLEFQQLLE